MYELLLPLIAVLFVFVKTREHFSLRVDPKAVIPVEGGNDRKLYTTDPNDTKGTQVVGVWPDSCPPGKEYDAGLCYEKCRDGFHGVGPVCWANTENVGVGKPVGLEPCPAGWTNDGLTCREPLRWDSCKSKFFGLCVGGLRGGNIQGRLNGGGICDWPTDRGNLPSWLVDKSNPKNYKATHPNKIAGLCYKDCPTNMPKRIPAMPYLCSKEGILSYGRGLGKIPCTVRAFDRCLFTGTSLGGE